MKLHTIFELAAKSDNELHAIYRNLFNKLAQSKEGSTDRRNALASLENVRRELGLRL